jgi:hypothetical protein
MNEKPSDYVLQVYRHWTMRGRKWDSRIKSRLTGDKLWQSSQGYENKKGALDVVQRFSNATGISLEVLDGN